MRSIFSWFLFSRKRAFLVLMLIILFGSLLEIFSFSALIPVIYLLNDPAFIQQNKITHALYSALHFQSDARFLFAALAFMMLLFILKNLYLLFSTWMLNRFVFSVSLDIVNRQVSQFFRSDPEMIRRHNTVTYLRSIVEAPQIFADFLMLPMIYVLNDSILVLLIILAILLYHPAVVILIGLTVLPFGFLMLRLIRGRLDRISKQKALLEQASYQESKEGISGYLDIRLFDKEDAFIRRINGVFHQLFGVNVRRNVYLMLPRRFIEVLVILIILLLFGMASFAFHMSNRELVLLLITFAIAAYRLLPSLNEIFTNIVNIRTWEYVLELLQTIDIKASSGPPKNYPELSFQHSIELKEVSFRYREHGRTFISDLNLVLHKGDIVVLTGESGTGKSTLSRLLAGFITPEKGKVLVDGKELEHPDQVKKMLAYVTQDFYLFDRTVLENIAIGETAEEADIARVEQAVAAARLNDFIAGLPLGLQQAVGEMGSRMSGGERQRLAMARALYKQASLLVFDEATASLDKENAQKVMEMVCAVARKEKLTVLIITHHAAMVEDYDALYELSEGKLNRLR